MTSPKICQKNCEEDISWWVNGRFKMHLAQRCFHNAWKVDGNWGNPDHAGHAKNEAHDFIPEVLEFAHQESGPWNVHNCKCCHHCEVRSTPAPDALCDVDPACDPVLKGTVSKIWDWNL